MSYWKSYESCTRSAKRSRNYAILYAWQKDWDRAFARAASAKTAQVKADEYFSLYLDELALTHVCNTTDSEQRRARARHVASAHHEPAESYRGQGSEEPLLDQP